VEAQAEAEHDGEELDTHTVGLRRALREQIAGVTRRMEELRTHLDSLETTQRHRRQAAAMSPAVRNIPEISLQGLNLGFAVALHLHTASWNVLEAWVGRSLTPNAGRFSPPCIRPAN
jgi:hypothetical protein